MSLYLGTTPIASDGSHRLTGEIGDIGFAPLGIDESLNLRRYLNGQVINQSQFVSFTNKLKSAVALYPSLSTTETNWQAEKTNSKLGQCGKFVIDDDAGTIRLPCVVNAQGLMDLQYLGTIKNESLPNITASFSVVGTEGSAAPKGAFVGDTANISETGQSGTAGVLTGFDASHSAPSYQNYAHVQQEAIQYPYYIQVATGIEETLPAVREYKVNNSDFFGKSMYSDVAPDNVSWLVSNGQWNVKSVYPDYYDWLLDQYNNPTESNVIKVGSILDNNGVLNGFSATNNVLLPVTFSPENNPWEIVIKFKTPQTFSEQGIISKTHQNAVNYGLRIALTVNSVLYYLIGSSYNTYICEGLGVQTLSTDTNYYVKFEFTGEAYKAYISTDAEDWTEDFSFSTTTPIESFEESTYLGDNRYKNIPFAGSIDLNESYININGNRWWNGRKAVVIKTGETSIFPDYDFIINTSNETFRLPLANGCENIPDWVNAQNVSTNIPFTAQSNGWLYGVGVFSGDALYSLNGIIVGIARGTNSWASNGTVAVRVKKGDIFSSNASFQSYGLNFIPAVGNGSLYYYVGDTVQDASLINAGAVLGQLSNKADIDAGNFTPIGKSTISGLGFLDTTKFDDNIINMTVTTVKQTFVAPANGHIYFVNESSTPITVYGTNCGSSRFGVSAGAVRQGSVSIQKGGIAYINTQVGTATLTQATFYYAKGEV